jgi:hypothetical protein
MEEREREIGQRRREKLSDTSLTFSLYDHLVYMTISFRKKIWSHLSINILILAFQIKLMSYMKYL